MSFGAWQQENKRPAAGFDQWYAGAASNLGLDPNPDDPRHFYDYRAAYKAGVEPPARRGGHWPSEYKLEGHPRMVLDGVNTKTGKPVDGFTAWQAQNKQPDLTTGQKIGEVKQFLERTQKQVQAEAQSADRYKIQRLLSLNPSLTPQQAERGAIGLTSSMADTVTDYAKQIAAGGAAKAVRAKLELQSISGGYGTGKDKKEAAERFKKQTIKEMAGQFQQQVQDVSDAEQMLKDQESLKGEFIAKTARRWDRGIVNTIGGGLYFMDTLTRAMELTGMDMGDANAPGGYAARSRAMHEILQAPTFQPVVENAFDKYFGAGVETAPFMISTMVPHVLSGGVTVPASLGSFLVAFGIEGNNAYQGTIDRGGGKREANMRGFTVGLFNGIIEMAGGSGGKFLKPTTARKVTSKLMKAKVVTKQFARNALKEGFLEELPQEFINMTAGGDVPKNLDGTVDWDAAFDQGWDAALTGTILGGAFNVPSTVSTAVKTKVQKKGEPLVNVPTTLDEVKAQEFMETVIGKVPVPALENIPNPSPIQTTVMDRNIKLRVAHQIAKKMGMKEEEFSAYKQTYGEQSSMADMTDVQLDSLLQQLQTDGTAAGLTAGDIAVELTPAEELTDQIKSLKQYKPKTEAELRDRGVVRQAYDAVKDKVTSYFDLQDRIRNIARMLDGYKDGGPFTRYIWDTIKQARTRKERVWNDMMSDFRTTLTKQEINVGEMMDTKRDDVVVDRDGKGLPVSDMERVGLYLHMQNKKNRTKVAAWFEDNNIDSKIAFAAIEESIKASDGEVFLAEQIAKYFTERSPAFLETAESLGIENIVKEEKYFPQLAENVGELTEDDVLGVFEDHHEGQLQMPGRKQTIARKGGREKIEWDAMRIFTRVSNKMESLIEVGPVAQEVNKILKDRKLRKAINAATNNHGAEIMGKWLRDSARGTSETSHGSAEKIVRSLRTNSVQYTLGLKIFTSAPKALLSIINGMSSRPAMAVAVTKVFSGYAIRGGLNRVKEEVYAKSDIMKNRDPERDIRTMWNDKTIRKFFAGKHLSHWSLQYWTFVDKAAANAVWLAGYRVAKADNMTETDARRYADARATESQPMASVEDLPAMFRGGELEKALTTFMTMLNTTHQFLKYDIIGEYKAGKISGRRATYRFMMGEMLPALVLGIIVRGRIPESGREIGEDLVSYLMSPLVFFGRFIFNMATQGYDPVKSGLSAIPLRGFEEGVDLFRDAVKAESGADIVEGTARTAGAFTGMIPEQGIITARGAYDLASGETDDYKRLMRTAGNIKYNAPASETAGTGRGRRSGRTRRKQARTRRQ